LLWPPSSSSSVSRYPFRRGRPPKVGRPLPRGQRAYRGFGPSSISRTNLGRTPGVEADGGSSGGLFGKTSGPAAGTQRPSCLSQPRHAQVRATAADHPGYRPRVVSRPGSGPARPDPRTRGARSGVAGPPRFSPVPAGGPAASGTRRTRAQTPVHREVAALLARQCPPAQRPVRYRLARPQHQLDRERQAGELDALDWRASGDRSRTWS
jgi:hypothetical protein